MTFIFRALPSALILTFLLPLSAQAHSGRTNSAGCHGGSQPYHCHSSGSSSSRSSSSSGQVYTARSHPWRANNPACHGSYEGVCLPLSSSDFDCYGGSGNGPNYVVGPLIVTGPDRHGLDRDGDGLGCE